MNNEVIIHKVITHANKVIEYCADLPDQRGFLDNPMLIEACVFNLSQIGELVSKLDRDYKDSHANIPWRTLYGLRNRIVHDYEGVNFNLVWELIKQDLPELAAKLINMD